MGRLADWGNYPVIDAEPLEFEQPEELREQLRSAGAYIAYGNGRSYGDASLQKKMLHTRRYRSLHAFDPATGVLRAESGVLLAEILELFVPRGWFLPVSPGTKFVTLGGAVAADIHGKNHHVEGRLGRMCSNLRSCARRIYYYLLARATTRIFCAHRRWYGVKWRDLKGDLATQTD